MGRYLDIADEWERNRKQPQSWNGHVVAEVIWQTEKMMIFRDPEGRLWRRVHAWKMTWPVTVVRANDIPS